MVGDYYEYFKNIILIFETLQKNGNKDGTIFKAGTLLYISAFKIVPTVLTFFVEFGK